VIINIDKEKIMIIKSRKTMYDTFIYDNNMEEIPLYKYLVIDIFHKLNCNYSIEKRINGVWKEILVIFSMEVTNHPAVRLGALGIFCPAT